MKTSDGPASGATVFPQPIGLAATMDTNLLGAIGTAISDESRALSNAAVYQNNGAVPGYLNCWAPNMNIFRDPRWGRGSETYGEDPPLTSELLAAYVQGVEGTAAQKKAAQYTKVISVCKHFMAYSLEEAEGQSRFWFDAVVSAPLDDRRHDLHLAQRVLQSRQRTKPRYGGKLSAISNDVEVAAQHTVMALGVVLGRELEYVLRSGLWI